MAKIFDNLRQKVKEFFVGYDPAEDLDVYSEDLYEKILKKYEIKENKQEQKNSVLKDNYGYNPEKILDRNKKLGEQSEYVQKAIESLLTGELIYEYKLRSNGSSYKDDVNKESCIKYFNESPDNAKEYILKNCNVKDLFNYLSDHDDYKILDAVTRLKKIGIEGERLNNVITIFDNDYLRCLDAEIYIKETAPISEDNKSSLTETTEQSPASDRQLETAKKTGYVQGVCESVLAFNNDENRKIMTEATISFLSKKLLSEMNVTKDMAQKFASPETYKALEKCVFTPKQEQKLEQTQSQGRGI